MKKQIKRFLILIGVFIAFCIFNQNKVNAASASISGSQTVTAGQTVTVTATVNAGAWNLTLSGGGQSRALVGQTSSAGNESASTSITFVATQNTTVTLTGDITDFSSNYSQTVNQSAQITVQSASTGGSGNTSSGNNQNSGNGSGTSGTTGGGTSGTINGGTTGSSSGSSTTTNNTSSSNANLSNLGIRPNDFSGFTPNRTSYSVTVPNSVTSIEVYANVGQSGQRISGTGTKNLSEGTNSFNVIVTAPDGTTTKTYTITVTREASEENEEEENQEEQNTTEENTEIINGNSVFGLTELKIDGIELDPSFSTEIYEYSAKLIGDKDKLDITATASEENAKVEITGNEGLVEGENIITILLTNEAGDKTAAYQIKLTKSLVDEEAIAREQELEREQRNRKIMTIAIVVAVILIIAIILILRRRRNKKLAEEYAIPYQGMDDDGDYGDEDNSYQKITDKFDSVEKDDWFNRDLTTQETDTDADLIEENQEPERKKRRKKKSKNIDEFDDNIENEEIDDDFPEQYEFKPAFSSKEELREQYLNQSFDKNIPFENEKRKGKGKRFK